MTRICGWSLPIGWNNKVTPELNTSGWSANFEPPRPTSPGSKEELAKLRTEVDLQRVADVFPQPGEKPVIGMGLANVSCGGAGAGPQAEDLARLAAKRSATAGVPER